MKVMITLFLLFFFNFGNSQMISSVYFAKNSDVLNEKYKSTLDSLSQLKSNFIFRVYGNCDPTGTSILNQKLSEKRVKSVTQYLESKIGNNINFGSTIGLGDSKQINDNSTEKLREKNRRVDIFIEKKLMSYEQIRRKVYPNFLTTPVSKMGIKDTFSIPDVNFVGGRHIWLQKGLPKLEKLFQILKDNPKVEVELQGHICCDYENFDGEDLDLKTFNLSVTRANAIRNYLIDKGIDPKRIRALGLGHLNPVIYPEITESDMLTNRRVEIMLINK